MVFRVRGMLYAPIFRQRTILTCHGGALFKLFYGVGKGGIGHMDIAIHGGFAARMTEQPLQDFRYDPAFNRARGVGVPLLVAGFQHIVCPVRQGNGSVAAS